MRRRRRAARDQSASGSRGGAEGPRGGAEGPLRGPRAAGLAPPPGAGNRKHVGLRTQSQSQLTVQGSTPRVEKGMERKQKDLLKKSKLSVQRQLQRTIRDGRNVAYWRAGEGGISDGLGVQQSTLRPCFFEVAAFLHFLELKEVFS